MASPMRIRAKIQGDNALVRVLMRHKMETGRRKDSAGKLIPAWHIQKVSASLNGKQVMSAEWGPSISENPYMQFTIKGAETGDKVSITWQDSRGDSRTDETIIR